MKIEKILFVTMIVLIIALPVIIWLVIKNDAEFKAACENKGGHVLRGGDFRACIDPKALR